MTLLKNIQKSQFESLLTALECKEHIFALEAVLIALDHRAKDVLERQIAVERDKNQKERETLQMLIRSLQTSLPEKPS
ncbi:MAG: hypothetical protein WBX38_20080 [Candidatus Sulfotelmatobacter sp.]